MEIDYSRLEHDKYPVAKLFMIAGMNSALEQMVDAIKAHSPVRELYKSFNNTCTALYRDDEVLAEKFALAGRKAYIATMHDCQEKRKSKLPFVQKAIDEVREYLQGNIIVPVSA